MKKLLLLLIFGMVLSFSACGNQGKENDLPNEQTSHGTQTEEPSTTENESSIQNGTIEDGAYLSVFSAKQYDSSESSVGANHTIDIVLSRDTYSDDQVEQVIVHTINGVDLEYRYEQSYEGWLYHDNYHCYKGIHNGKSTEIRVDSQTGECLGFLKFPYQSEGDENPFTGEQKYEIAYAFLSQNVEDPEQYIWDPDMGVGDSYFWFYRHIGELKTCDYMVIAIDDAGEVFSYDKNNLGEMKNVQPVPDAIMQSVYVVLEEEAKSIYRQIEQNGCTWSYEAEIDRLVRLEDGSLALDCSVHATITTKDGRVVSDGAWFIIPITEPTVQKN